MIGNLLGMSIFIYGTIVENIIIVSLGYMVTLWVNVSNVKFIKTQ